MLKQAEFNMNRVQNPCASPRPEHNLDFTEKNIHESVLLV